MVKRCKISIQGKHRDLYTSTYSNSMWICSKWPPDGFIVSVVVISNYLDSITLLDFDVVD